MPYLQFLATNTRWLLGGFLLTMFSSFGQTFYISLSTGDVRQAFELTSGEYGTLYMAATLASAMTLPLLGQIVDRYSVVTVTAISTIMLALACLALAGAKSILMLVLALYGLRLFGQGMMSHISITAMGRWYAENRGKAVSIASLGFNVGLALSPVCFVAMVGIMGWRNSWLVAALVLVFVALPSIALLMRVERVPRGSVQVEIHEPGRQWTRSEMVRDPLFWLANVGVLAPSFISTAIFFHQDFLLETMGWSLDLYALTFVVMTVVSVLSGLIAGIAVDRTSAVTLLPAMLLPLGLGCVILAWFSTPLALTAYMALLGISIGLMGAIFGSLWPEIYGTQHLGSIRALIMAIMVFSSALGPGVMGWLIDFGLPLATQFAWMGLYCFAAAGALLFCSLRFRHRKIAWNTEVALV
jgi:MFS family permease